MATLNNNIDNNFVNVPIEMEQSRLPRDLKSAANDAEHLLQDNPPVAKPEIDDDEWDMNYPTFPQLADDYGLKNFRRVGSFVPNLTYTPGIGADGYIDRSAASTPIPDVNIYQQKKTLAQGMMDLALLSANANQLRYVLESYNRHPYYYPSLVFISLSLLFQIAVGIGLILNSKYDVKDDKEICKANKINNLTVIGIFIVTVVNVFISAFGVADAPPDNNG